MKPKVLIIRTAGTNCDKETEFAFATAGARTRLEHINHVKEHKRLCDYQIIAIPGGFSYGDDLGAGKIFSLELLLWLKDALRVFIDNGGLLIGICNGFQVMVKTGMLPDVDFIQRVTLTFNDSGRFEDRWTYLKVSQPKLSAQNIWLKGLPDVVNLPIAHGEGKFYTSEQILDTMQNNGQIVLQYCNSKGEAAGYPFNPNGSYQHIAGITDITGRIFGLMPHPERFIFRHHWPHWRERERSASGLTIFKNSVTYFK